MFVSQITLSIKTSAASYAGTEDFISASFHGDVSISGPHRIGSFKAGSDLQRTILLDRYIGSLRKVVLYNPGTDGWLLSQIECTLEYVYYFLSGPRQWLDSINATLLDLYGNGYEPFCQEDLRTVPAKSTLELQVKDSFRIYSNLGGNINNI